MKIIILLMFLVSGCYIFDPDADERGCYTDGVWINSESTLKRAQNLKYSCLQGSIKISGEELEVVKLSNINKADTLNIEFTTRLKEVSIINLGGVSSLIIRQNAVLEDVSELPHSSDITIQDNPVLVSLSGLSQITSIGTGLSITRNASLPNLKDFANLTYVRALRIEENASLNTLSHLALEEKPFHLNIIENQSLPYCDICDLLEGFVNEEGVLKRAHEISLHGNKPDECGDETVETALDLNCPFDFE